MKECLIKDKILTYCIKDGINDNFVIATEIITDVFPKMKNEEMMYYISEISKHPDLLIDYYEYNDTYVIKSDITIVKFLENGGFCKIEKINTQNTTKAIKKEEIELALANSNIKVNRLNKKIAKQNIKNEKKNRITTWINILIGILNLALLVWQILKD